MAGVKVIDVEFTSNGESIHGHLVMPDTVGPFPAICKLHGLPGSPDQVSGIATEFARAGFVVLVFDFRGFRSSEGIFSISGEVIDAKNAISFLLDREETAGNRVGLYGASFGGAIAICTAARDERVCMVGVRAPVVDTAAFAASRLDEIFQFVEQIAPDDMHGLNDDEIRAKITAQILRDVKTYNPINDVLHIAPRPLLVVTGDADALIRITDVHRLVDKAENVTFHVVHGADHSLSNVELYNQTNRLIVDWFSTQVDL